MYDTNTNKIQEVYLLRKQMRNSDFLIEMQIYEDEIKIN